MTILSGYKGDEYGVKIGDVDEWQCGSEFF